MSACCTTPPRPAPPWVSHQPAPSASPAVTGHTAATLEATELLLRAGKGDPSAWQEILRRYRGVVFAKVRTFRLQDADALDAVQMTWLRLAENIHQIQHPERLGGWLATTATRECLHILRRAQRTQTLTEAVADNLPDPATGPEQRVIDTQTAQTLRTLIAELPPRRRRLLQALFSDHPRPTPSCPAPPESPWAASAPPATGPCASSSNYSTTTTNAPHRTNHEHHPPRCRYSRHNLPIRWFHPTPITPPKM
ncbi:MAG: sigma-70 family RNA polymerase sigma factor, partial [Actinobacteria bacterium]|nr:sigma-70 family RNA polymerase sigma factor [Actinomycetota bacterium]